MRLFPLFWLLILWLNLDKSSQQNEATCNYPADPRLSYFYGREQTTLGATARYDCRRGYKSTDGANQATCTRDGWRPNPLCQEITCDQLDIPHAEIVNPKQRYRYREQVNYVCKDGYVGNPNRTCERDGWSGNSNCTAQPCPVIHVDRNVQVNGDPEEATFGNVVRFSCKSNMDILFGPAEIYCDENGEWSGPAPKCKEITCMAPTIENGDVLGDIERYSEHEVLQFVCHDKYKPAEERSPKCTKIGPTADWSPTPLCELIICKLKPPIEGTSYDPAYRNVFSPGDTVRVTCGNKYWISNPQETSAVVTCREDGEWSVSLPCKAFS